MPVNSNQRDGSPITCVDSLRAIDLFPAIKQIAVDLG
jgi:hypothetical protein